MGTSQRETTPDAPAADCDCKVGNVARRYGCAGVSRELERLWTGEADDRYSLRELADYFNESVLEAAMDDAGMNPLEGEVANVYRLLTDDEASSGDRVDAERRLAYEGVPVEEVRDDFLTHQTVYRHLKNCVQAEYQREDDPDARLERDVERIDSFRNRMQIVVGEIVRRLRDAGLFRIATPRAYVDVQIVCEDCGAQYGPRDLLDADGCRCDRPDD